MAIVKGIREKVHLPIYDSIYVKPEEQLRKLESSSTLKFFVDVQGKTKLETNLQAASLLPHYNTFEARAMRVIFSDLPPQFPEEPTAESDEPFDVTDEDDFTVRIGTLGQTSSTATIDSETTTGTNPPVTADFELGLDRLMELLKEARDSDDGYAALPVDDDDVTLFVQPTPGAQPEKIGNDGDIEAIADLGGTIWLSVADLESYIEDLEKDAPPKEQIRPNDGAGNIVSKFIYNTVTTFYVGEKVMIEMPTWNFPGGSGAWSLGRGTISHGEPSPLATFRFAEPIYIDRQQNFRVELEVPDADVLKEVQKIYGPLYIWVVLDGYMTRGVQ
jgi:hypothetical protein